MADGNFILTQEGKDKLEEELHFLETEKRAEIGERIKVAREFGDISENSEYDDAKNEQGMMEARIAEISRILSEATVVNTPKRSNSVHIGSTVTVDMGGRERVFTIVGGAESDAAAGKISNESPVGSVLLGHKKGDVVETTGPTGRKITMTFLKLEHLCVAPFCERRNLPTLRDALAPDLAARPRDSRTEVSPTGTSFGARFALALPTISGTRAPLADLLRQPVISRTINERYHRHHRADHRRRPHRRAPR